MESEEICTLILHFIVSALIGKFYEGDCYIILQTYINDSHQLDWKIWYWIGEKASVRNENLLVNIK